jgi:hypothetical protein
VHRVEWTFGVLGRIDVYASAEWRDFMLINNYDIIVIRSVHCQRAEPDCDEEGARRGL